MCRCIEGANSLMAAAAAAGLHYNLAASLNTPLSSAFAAGFPFAAAFPPLAAAQLAGRFAATPTSAGTFPSMHVALGYYVHVGLLVKKAFIGSSNVESLKQKRKTSD